MPFFIKISENTGIWANKDKALEYLSKGYQVYTDENQTTEMKEGDLEAVDDAIRAPEDKTVTVESKADQDG